MTSDTQKLLLQTWARDISHVVTDGTPKAEFARLAKAKGWVGGDEQWCRHWKMCFLEVYPYGKCKFLLFLLNRERGRRRGFGMQNAKQCNANDGNRSATGFDTDCKDE